ncbi:MAG: glycosyltransferase [Thermoanaerobaculia bacterium]|nr:glycosyltransferase [Thermoanaerobaculia bacterium]
MSQTTDSSPEPAVPGRSKVLVSTVTPVYRGARTLDELVSRIDALRRRWSEPAWPFELVESIFVDDASVDESSDVLERLEAEYDFVRVVTLSRNFGQHPATSAGILHSSGDWVLTLDEDLQHRPEDIELLLERATIHGSDVLYAQPAGIVHRSWYRDRASRGYKRLLSLSTGDPNVRLFNSFRAVRGSIARAAAAVVGHDTFLDIAIGWFTQRVGARRLDLLDSREGGYTFRRLLSHARRAMISSQTKWLRLGAAVGIGALSLSVLLLVWIMVQKVLAPASIEVRGWTSLFLTTAFFGGLVACLVGVSLEYLRTLVLGAHGKPNFFVVDRSIDVGPRRYFADHPLDVSGEADAVSDGASKAD